MRGYVISGSCPCGGEFGVPSCLRNRGPAQRQPEWKECFPPGRLHGNHRHAQLLGKAHGIHRRPLCHGDVDHVQRDDCWESQLQDLRDKIEVSLEMGGVDHAEDALGPRCVLTQIEEDVASDAFVGSVRADAVTAREIEQLNPFSMLADELTGLFLHGDAGIIGHLLSQSCQGVEKGRLAAVGIADNGVRFGTHFRGRDCRIASAAVMGDREDCFAGGDNMGRR